MCKYNIKKGKKTWNKNPINYNMVVQGNSSLIIKIITNNDAMITVQSSKRISSATGTLISGCFLFNKFSHHAPQIKCKVFYSPNLLKCGVVDSIPADITTKTLQYDIWRQNRNLPPSS